MYSDDGGGGYPDDDDDLDAAIEWERSALGGGGGGGGGVDIELDDYEREAAEEAEAEERRARGKPATFGLTRRGGGALRTPEHDGAWEQGVGERIGRHYSGRTTRTLTLPAVQEATHAPCRHLRI